MNFLQIEHAVYALGSSGWWGGIGIFSLYVAVIWIAASRLQGEDALLRF